MQRGCAYAAPCLIGCTYSESETCDADVYAHVAPVRFALPRVNSPAVLAPSSPVGRVFK